MPSSHLILSRPLLLLPPIPPTIRVFSSESAFLPSAYFMVQLLHLYMTNGKTIALIILTFVGKVMSLLFNRFSRFVIAFLPRSKHLFTSFLQVNICSDFGAQENKVYHCFHCFPIYLPWSDETGCHDLSFLNVEFSPFYSWANWGAVEVPSVMFWGKPGLPLQSRDSKFPGFQRISVFF